MCDLSLVTFVPSGTRITVFANRDLWLRSETEDEEEEDGGESPATDGTMSNQMNDTFVPKTAGGEMPGGGAPGGAAQGGGQPSSQTPPSQTPPSGQYYNYGGPAGIPAGAAKGTPPQMPAETVPQTQMPEDGVPELF